MAKKRKTPPSEEGANEENAGASSSTEQVPKFGQLLASNDKLTRDKAVKALTRYLKSGRVVEELELAKIWKALFYCMWHSDKPKVQSELAERLASLVHVVPGGRATLFAKVFWATMMREWVGIDRLRLNKFYTLQRCMLQQSLRQLRRADWPSGGAEAYARMLSAGPLGRAAPTGMRYWLLDNYVPALAKELADETPAEVWMELLEPLFLALATAPDAHSLQRTTEGSVDALLAFGEASGEAEGGEAEGEEVPALTACPVELPRLAERVFELASDGATREANRAHLYSLHGRLEQRAAESGAPKGGAVKSGAAKGSAPPRAATAAAAAPPKAAADPSKVNALRLMMGGKAAAGSKAASASKPKPASKPQPVEAEPTPEPKPPKKRKAAQLAEPAAAPVVKAGKKPAKKAKAAAVEEGKPSVPAKKLKKSKVQ